MFGLRDAFFMPAALRLAAAVMAVFTLVACGDDDGGSQADPLTVSTIFGPCEIDAQCPRGGECRTNVEGYPNGYCTVPCSDRTPCFEELIPGTQELYNVCADIDGDGDFFCERGCINGADCGRTGYSCLDAASANVVAGRPDEGACIPLCEPDSCGDGAVCDPLLTECVDEMSEEPTGSDNGEPCRADSDCLSGICLEEREFADAVYPGGYCASRCALPQGYTPNALWGEDLFPQGGCPMGNVCVPGVFADGMPGTGFDQGDIGSCFVECTGPDDCRTGYVCAMAFGMGQFSYDNGFCLPEA